ncbi:hypothetical protein JMM81_15950 [Bacillus sp. V3B]|uniref:pLS20_p028 family conjugation system transmembrane protein n=1 Tax=Bacillus sp. V3B TaxID=2804915 RepID=UPI002108D7E4|nr:hypothetical protein [Bacillus sp. V3B]MCQ6276408.1 hypothetical protein [Bacillus sp. V3B]
MSKEEIAEKLHQFSEFLNLSNLFSDMFRWLGWVIAVGLSMLVDGLEAIINEVLLVKTLFENPEYVNFVNSFRPLFSVLLAVSLLIIGYQLIFHKKTNREAIVFNLVVALFIVTTLTTATNKVNDFTDEAIETIQVDSLYGGEENGTIGQAILKNNLTDVVLLDKKGWSTTELETENTIQLKYIPSIDIQEKLESDSDNYQLSSDGKEIASNKIAWNTDTSEASLIELDQGGLVGWDNEYYYRYHIDWFTLLTTLVVIGFTLFSISFKLARLSFELAFNNLLATIIAPVDMHDGQKTKKILQDIISIFTVIIMIFLSMKIYMVGVEFLEENLSGLAYLIALIGFSVALIDGPNIVERLFGIDAGVKSGWNVLAGAYATYTGTKGLAGGVANLAKGTTNLASKFGGNNGNGNLGTNNKASYDRSPLSKVQPPSPFSSNDSKDLLENKGNEKQADTGLVANSTSKGIEQKQGGGMEKDSQQSKMISGQDSLSEGVPNTSQLPNTLQMDTGGHSEHANANSKGVANKQLKASRNGMFATSVEGNDNITTTNQGNLLPVQQTGIETPSLEESGGNLQSTESISSQANAGKRLQVNRQTTLAANVEGIEHLSSTSQGSVPVATNIDTTQTQMEGEVSNVSEQLAVQSSVDKNVILEQQTSVNSSLATNENVISGSQKNTSSGANASDLVSPYSTTEEGSKLTATSETLQQQVTETGTHDKTIRLEKTTVMNENVSTIEQSSDLQSNMNEESHSLVTQQNEGYKLNRTSKTERLQRIKQHGKTSVKEVEYINER